MWMLAVDRVRPARCRRAQCGARHVMAWTRWCLVCSCLPSTSGTGLCSPTWALTLFPLHPLSMASLYPRFTLSSTNLSGKSLILANCFFYCCVILWPWDEGQLARVGCTVALWVVVLVGVEGGGTEWSVLVSPQTWILYLYVTLA